MAWYQEVLGLQRRHEQAWGNDPAVVGVGNTSLALFPLAGPEPKPPPGHPPLYLPPGAGGDTEGERHVAFRVNRKNFAAAPLWRGLPTTPQGGWHA